MAKGNLKKFKQNPRYQHKRSEGMRDAGTSHQRVLQQMEGEMEDWRTTDNWPVALPINWEEFERLEKETEKQKEEEAKEIEKKFGLPFQMSSRKATGLNFSTCSCCGNHSHRPKHSHKMKTLRTHRKGK